MNVAATLGFSLVCWGVFLYLFHKDRSRYRNCYVLTFAILSLFPLIICISGNNWQEPMIVIIMAFLLSILIVPFFLIYNGFVMMRKEGRHLSQLLSLGLGIAILAGEAILAAGVLYYAYVGNKTPFLIQRTIWPVLGAVFCMTVIYGSVSFLIFMIYTLFLQIIPRKKDFDYVIIHGSGLLEGDRVPKLLQDRLDKAIEVYRQDPTPPKLIPSGGQGSDESIPEAEAMKRYLLSKGIPEEDILPEERSTTTLENLRYSQEIINSFPDLPEVYRHRQSCDFLLLAERHDPGIHCDPRRKEASDPVCPGMALLFGLTAGDDLHMIKILFVRHVSTD